MVRMSMLRNRGVYLHGKQIGLLQNVCLNLAQKTVHSLIVAGGLKGKQIVYSNQILSMTGEEIHVCETIRYKKSLEPPKQRFVRDDSGLLFGQITDYLFDEERQRLIAIHIIRGYLTKEERERIWVYSWFLSKKEEINIPWLYRPVEDFEEA